MEINPDCRHSRWVIRAGIVVCSLLVFALTGSATGDDRSRAGSQTSGTNAPPAVEQVYPQETGHWVGLVMDRGARVKLEDASVWEIAPKNQSQTPDWRVAQKISVSRNPNERFPFRLTNLDLKVTVDARLAVRPR